MFACEDDSIYTIACQYTTVWYACGTMSTNRLTRTQWLDHGLHTLAAEGFTALKADTLAKSLGVSRGSFYWHFKNLAHFHSAVLGRWQALTVAGTIADVEAENVSPIDRLRHLITIAATSDPSLVQAIRAWAYNDPAVRAATAQIDEQRLGYVQQLLQAMGLDEAVAQRRAWVIYSSYLGQIMLGKTMAAEEQTAIIDHLIQFARPH